MAKILRSDQIDIPNPREDYDTFGTLVFAHRSTTLGEVDPRKEYPDAGSWDDVREEIINENPRAVVLPVYMYDHSGQVLSTQIERGWHHAAWDAGQVGFIYATKAQVDDEFGGDYEKAAALLKAEIATLSGWLSGAAAVIIDDAGDSHYVYSHDDYDEILEYLGGISLGDLDTE